ncbi:unnamed protein product [Linum tenue]|uniref:Uncharacterized protein n=1 Tax=Linum tenue TaxID=586396 RepID=A0AAV0L0F2_9ROSI|nr:unnamed protein product [Linum tenue]
MSNRDQPRQK